MRNTTIEADTDGTQVQLWENGFQVGCCLLIGDDPVHEAAWASEIADAWNQGMPMQLMATYLN